VRFYSMCPNVEAGVTLKSLDISGFDEAGELVPRTNFEDLNAVCSCPQEKKYCSSRFFRISEQREGQSNSAGPGVGRAVPITEDILSL
jgi:hypothetical protein